MNKIYQKVCPAAKTFANPQLGGPARVVIAGVDRQSRKEETSNKQTGSRVHARDDRQGRKGFTLIELLVVVLIIGILAAVALPQYQTAVLRSRAAELMTVARQLQQAQDRYYLANGKYSADFAELDISLSGAVSNTGSFPVSLVTPKGLIYKLYEGFVSGNIDNVIGFTYYYSARKDSHVARCYAVVGNKEAEQVCRSMGGELISSNEPCSIGKNAKCNIYKLW